MTAQAALVATQGQELSPVDTEVREKDWCTASFAHRMPFHLSTLVLRCGRAAVIDHSWSPVQITRVGQLEPVSLPHTRCRVHRQISSRKGGWSPPQTPRSQPLGREPTTSSPSTATMLAEEKRGRTTAATADTRSSRDLRVPCPMSLRDNIIGVISKRTTPSPVARTQNYFVNPQEPDLYQRLMRRRTINGIAHPGLNTPEEKEDTPQ